MEPNFLKTKIVIFKSSLDEFYGDTRDAWCVTLEGGKYNGGRDDHVDLAEFKTRKEAREYAAMLKRAMGRVEMLFVCNC